MRFNFLNLRPEGKLALAITIIISLLVAYILLFHPPRAEAIKTLVVELGTEDGIYDGKVKFWREADNILIFDIDGVLLQIEDNDISIAGKIVYRADGTDVPVSDGGTGKSSGTQYAIPFYDTTASFSEIPIGAAEKVLAVNATTNGYEWADVEAAPLENVIIVAKSGGDYTTIQPAIDSITDSSPTKPYVVLIYPGVYELTGYDVILLNKSYVSLVGIQPNGAKITEAQNSGVIIKYQSPGAGWNEVLLLKGPTPTTDLVGVTIANLTIINTQALGEGDMQGAINIGKEDTRPRAHEILIKNCSLYGEQDTVFVNTGNPIFQDCYIEGSLDIVSIADDTIFERTQIFNHGDSHSASVWMGFYDATFTTSFIDCVFDRTTPASEAGVGRWVSDNTITNFYGCEVKPNCATSCWSTGGNTGTINLYTTNGKGWPPGQTNFIEQQELAISGDANIKGGLNVGTAIGASEGQGKFSATVDALSFTIGANVLTTTEWAFLDGQNQAVKTSDSPTFVDATMTGYVSTHGNELLATDIIRHTVTQADVEAHEIPILGYNITTPAKAVSLTPSLYQVASSGFSSELNADIKSWFVGTTIVLLEGTVSWAKDDVITVQIVYEK